MTIVAPGSTNGWKPRHVDVGAVSATSTRWWIPGALALGVIFLLTGLPLAAMLHAAGELAPTRLFEDPWIARVVRFSIVQAVLSTLLSVGLAVPVALALSHEPRFVGRSVLVSVFSLSLVIPTLVAIYGIVAVYGRSGWLNTSLGSIGIEPLPLYGLVGILVAHVFFNLPLAARVMLQTLEGIPDNEWRLAAQLGMRSLARFRLIEWPYLKAPLIGVSVLIFTLCFTSFAIVMTLGGGPRATTIEVAIYQALRFDFDLPLAVSLALVQLLFCVLLMIASTLAPETRVLGFTADPGMRRFLQHRPAWRPPIRGVRRVVNATVIVIAAAFVMLPLLALLMHAANDKFVSVLFDPKTLEAAANTLVAATTASLLSIALALGLLWSTRHLRIRHGRVRSGHWLQLSGNIILVLPPVVLGTGLFLLLRPWADVFSLALLLVITINALMALPFALRILESPMIRAASRHDRLIQSLEIQGWNRWRLIDWPQLRRPIGLAMAMAATLSAGDLSAIALFGSDQVRTLPLLLYQRMGSYRLEEAAVTAGLLLLLCLFLFALLQRVVGGPRAGTR